ncbi:hypothetical protein ABPG74_009067 [Tetrahymena malaccensis]
MMNSSLRFTLLETQFDQKPTVIPKKERKPLFQQKKIINPKCQLSLKNEQILELFLPPFYEDKDNQSEELTEIVSMECVCGHCQNCIENQDNGNDLECVSTRNNLDQSLLSNKKKNNNQQNDFQNDQIYQKIRLCQDRIRLQNIQMKNLQKLADINGLANLLRVDVRSGLSNYNQSDLANRVKLYGANRVIIGKNVSFKNIIKENFYQTKTLLILIFVVALFTIRSYILYTQVGNLIGILHINEIYIEIGTMFMMVATFVTKCLKQWFIDKEFNNLVCVNTEYKVKILRNSQVQYIKSTQLVVGDIMMVEAGDIINVDGILIESYDLKVNESPLISGRENASKQAPDRDSYYVDCFIYSGTQIMVGQGKMIVCCVGNNTILDRVQKKNQDSIFKNPLSDKLNQIQTKIGSSSTNSSTLIILFIMFEYFWDAHYQKQIFTLQTFCDLIQLIQMILALSFLLMPEGLTQALDTYLSYSVKQLETQEVIIKDLSALEWMGYVDSIVTDKTGCVTENKNRVEKIYTNQEQTVDDILASFREIEKKNLIEKKKERDFIGQNRKIEQLLFENICINSVGVLQKEQVGQEAHNTTVETALLEFALKFGYDYEKYRIQSKIKKVHNFNTNKKRMITVFQKNQSTLRCYLKGSPDVLLDKCSRFTNIEGRPSDMHSSVKQLIQDRITQYGAKETLKLIFFAYKDIEYDPTQIYAEEQINQDLVFVGIVCIRDPFRLDMPECLKTCQEASITVRALTGDNKESAVSTAKFIGYIFSQSLQVSHNFLNTQFKGLLPENFDIKTSNMAVLDGDQFKKIVEGIETFQSQSGRSQTIQRLRGIDQFQKHIKELRMISKGRSAEKDQLVTGLIQLKYVVAVTGDDTDDIKIINKAQVGIGLGQSGNEVVKQAAQIILKNDSFTSIIPAILWGRNIYEFVRKYFQLIISQSQIIILLLLLNVIVWERHLFNAAQFLLVNVLVDEFAAHALAREYPSEHLLSIPPIRRKEYIIKPVMWRNIIFETLYQILALSLLLFGDLEFIFNMQNQFFRIDSSSIDKYIRNVQADQDGLSQEEFKSLKKQNLRFRYSLCFNCLVFLQLFNILSCSSLHYSKIRVFRDIKRKFFLFVSVLFILGFYILLMHYFHDYFECTKHGLPEHFLCLTISLTKLFYNYLIRFINHRPFSSIRYVKYTFDFE